MSIGDEEPVLYLDWVPVSTFPEVEGNCPANEDCRETDGHSSEFRT
jgi:hypothetical protein